MNTIANPSHRLARRAELMPQAIVSRHEDQREHAEHRTGGDRRCAARDARSPSAVISTLASSISSRTSTRHALGDLGHRGGEVVVVSAGKALEDQGEDEPAGERGADRRARVGLDAPTRLIGRRPWERLDASGGDAGGTGGDGGRRRGSARAPSSRGLAPAAAATLGVGRLRGGPAVAGGTAAGGAARWRGRRPDAAARWTPARWLARPAPQLRPRAPARRTTVGGRRGAPARGRRVGLRRRRLIGGRDFVRCAALGCSVTRADLRRTRASRSPRPAAWRAMLASAPIPASRPDQISRLTSGLSVIGRDSIRLVARSGAATRLRLPDASS